MDVPIRLLRIAALVSARTFAGAKKPPAKATPPLVVRNMKTVLQDVNSILQNYDAVKKTPESEKTKHQLLELKQELEDFTKKLEDQAQEDEWAKLLYKIGAR
jgi:hypothetical protein